MTRYINKADVVAEIERIRTLVGDGKFLSEYESGCRDKTLDICDDLLSFLDTLEPKKVVELYKIRELLRNYEIKLPNGIIRFDDAFINDVCKILQNET